MAEWARGSPNIVRDKLPATLDSFLKDAPVRLDLIVGTHYDGDHLKGLLPIVEDESIEIGEVWLPPLKNDTQEILGPLESDDFLAQQFFDDETDTVLFHYLWVKAVHVEKLQTWEREVLDIVRTGRDGDARYDFDRPKDLPQYGALLFASIPDAAKVKHYRALIHPTVPLGPGSDEGEVRLSYQHGISAWCVERHAITV